MKQQNALLESVATQAAEDLKAQFIEANDDLLNAIHKMQEEAQLQESKPKFNIGFKITLDFDKSTFDCDLSWTIKQSLSTSHTIEDVNQTKLPLERYDDTKMTISSGNTKVETTVGEFSKLSRKLAKK